MKKLYTLLTAVLLTSLSFGQSPRLVLVEEFTGETCGPCAGANPGFNTILDAHASNVISLKYQNNIPSAGPNFYAYNSADISNRTAFYANNYSPHAWIDGNYWNGNAASVTGAQLTARGSVTSPFTIEVSHSFSPNHDIIYIHTVVRASQTVSNANLHLRTAVSERNVYGYTSPNGEDVFSHVMRKLLPTGTGTTLPTTWAAGDSSVSDQQWTITIPTNPAVVDLPIWAMLEAIVWVQDDATKQIMQTGLSPAVVNLDPAIVSISGVPSVTCSSVTPSVTVTNNEATPVSSLDIEYYLDSQSPIVYSWTGTINQGATAIITLGTIAMSQGAHNIYVNITNVNGSPDVVLSNNSRLLAVGQPLAASMAFSETFTPVSFPPANWINEDNDYVTGWSRSAANSTSPGTGSAKIDFYNSPQGQVDVLYPLTPLDITTGIAPTLSFKVAHRQYSAAYSDLLEVIISTDCGVTWTPVWSKSGANLSTVAGFATAAFTPTVTQWRSETIDLSSYIGQTNVLFAFKATSDYGNNAFIDQVYFSPWNVLGITDNSNDVMVNIYPSPSSGIVSVNVEKVTSPMMDVSVTNVVGKVVKQMSFDKSEGNVMSIDLSNEANGNYLVKIVTASETILKRAVIQK